ncbi:DUF2442 domain-containing protein [Synechocystis salina]|uniref:DUF2442 domain-containing protein n=1 Tax=Synechocystis salina LEGE 00031 TaxID=1828736 RepID=A0ABR9VW99_9SYNC|nr:DUF2442 domain-containing protein [Synechocystis salina]MBE9242826.1 DUF2442 domain-containing protein [Synechocystis salina LEGE 00041]MBE9255624.1 DUF2442 domain-containing protein [Synechocystis salina LEGE 00031]
MNSSTLDTLLIQKVTITDEALSVYLSDGRSISVPLVWYPRLLHSSPEERHDYRLIDGGIGIYWTQLEEDISVKNLVLGQPPGDSQRSLKCWLGDHFLSRS